jgi:hypothetical protein
MANQGRKESQMFNPVITSKIERKPVFVAARNEFEAIALATAKFARATGRGYGDDNARSSLNHHTTGKPVYKCVMLPNGDVLAGLHN